VYGEAHGPIVFVQTLEAAKKTEHYSAPLGPNQGRGVAAGFWFNKAGDTSGRLDISEDGSVHLTLGTIDIAGTRSSISMMAAEELGIPLDRVKAPAIANTDQLSYNRLTAGSRVTFCSGMIVVDAARKAIAEMRRRASAFWRVSEEDVVYADGFCRVAKPSAGNFKPLSIADIVKQGGPISCESAMAVTGAGPGFGLHIVDVEADKETGAVKILRYTVVEDAGKAINRRQVEGQYQGGAAQGAGWALNEEYIYGEDGRLQNPSFLDYRMPVASDLPMIDTVIVEVPNPKHPYGLRGVGEVPVVPTLAAIANAVAKAIGVRPRELPMSPPRLLKLIETAGKSQT
jgi:CO/xanthine dehydrogenase Mo-binding subunit